MQLTKMAGLPVADWCVAALHYNPPSRALIVEMRPRVIDRQTVALGRRVFIRQLRFSEFRPFTLAAQNVVIDQVLCSSTSPLLIVRAVRWVDVDEDCAAFNPAGLFTVQLPRGDTERMPAVHDNSRQDGERISVSRLLSVDDQGGLFAIVARSRALHPDADAETIEDTRRALAPSVDASAVRRTTITTPRLARIDMKTGAITDLSAI